jgi:hypothetical protein
MAERTTYTPAFYARRGGLAADWWTLLHPPYTVWHLSYVVLGAAMAPALDWTALGLAVLAFFLAVGVAAHALDELQGRPLGTGIGDGLLRAVASLALLAACALGVYGVLFHAGLNLALAVAVPVGALLVVGYNLELFGGRLHNDRTFAWGWGGFPVAVGYVAQAPGLVWSSAAAAVAAVLAGVGTSYAQRRLSTPARTLRRRTSDVTGTVTDADGRAEPLDRAALLAPLEGALRALSWAVPVVALATLLSRV